MSPSETRRRSDEDRSRRTRERILIAAVDTLIENGYAATSISTVQTRAGVSRGALLHQYSSKAHLLVDAVRHLAEQQAERLTAATRPQARGETTDWLPTLWVSFADPVFGAVLELWIAARTDPELHGVLLDYERQLRRTMRTLVLTQIGGDPPSNFDSVFDMTLTYYRGVALTGILSDRHRSALLDDWKIAVATMLR